MFGKTAKNDKVDENKDVEVRSENQNSVPATIEEMDKLFDQFANRQWLHPFSWRFPEFENFGLRSQVRVPSVDVVEKDNNIIVRAEIPGVDKKNIDVTLNGNILTIQGKNKHEKKEVTEEYHRSEISSGSFSRTLTLPSDVDGNNVKATFVDGLLEVTLPKIESSNKNRINID